MVHGFDPDIPVSDMYLTAELAKRVRAAFTIRISV